MSITASEMTPADIAAVTNNGGGNGFGGFGGDNGAWWLLVLLFAMNGGWFGGNRGGNGGGYGAGAAGGNELYPWLNQNETVNDGFRDQMLQTNVQGIQNSINALATQLCNCCCDMRQTVSDGFAGAEANANARQIANMNQAFGMQTAMMQGFNALGSQTAELRSTVIAENCADREALNSIGRDIIENANRNNQAILDKLCQLELDGVKQNYENRVLGLQNALDQARTDNQSLRFAASQTAQNAFIAQGLNQEVDALYNRLSNCPVPTTPVYGRTPIFTCPNGNPCGCGNG